MRTKKKTNRPFQAHPKKPRKAVRPKERVICFLFVGSPDKLGDELASALRQSGAIDAIKEAYVELSIERSRQDAKKGKGVGVVFDGEKSPSIDELFRQTARASRRDDLRRARRQWKRKQKRGQK